MASSVDLHVGWCRHGPAAVGAKSLPQPDGCGWRWPGRLPRVNPCFSAAGRVPRCRRQWDFCCDVAAHTFVLRNIAGCRHRSTFMPCRVLRVVLVAYDQEVFRGVEVGTRIRDLAGVLVAAPCRIE